MTGRMRVPAVVAVMASVVVEAQPPKPQPSTGAWKTAVTQSKMDDSKTVALHVSALGTITGWPNKTVRPELWIRCQERQTTVYVVTGMHPAVESGNLSGATVQIRLDKDPARTLPTSKSSDSEALFFASPIPLIKTMATKSTMLFRFTPFNSSPQEAEFNLAGLASVLPPLREACGWSQSAEQAAKARAAQSAEAEADARSIKLAREIQGKKAAFQEAVGKLGSPEPRTRWEGAEAIAQTDVSERATAIPKLIELLNDPALEVRGAASRALGNMGSLAVAAIPALEEALKDPKRENMARAFRDALDKIRKAP